MPGLEVIILAAGQGTRMRSRTPKVLHALAGRPMLEHVIDTAQALQPNAIHVVYGHGGAEVQQRFSEFDVNWVCQAEQLGTGHAVREALPSVQDAQATVLVLYGDVPMVNVDILRETVALAGQDSLVVVTAKVLDPTGYGRILRTEQGEMVAIREQKDATPGELEIDEINSGIMAAPCVRWRTWLKNITADNLQGELYLTDAIPAALTDKVRVSTVMSHNEDEISGINDRRQLARLERAYQRLQADELMLAGTTLADPERIDVRGTLTVGQDVYIDVNAVFEGSVTLGDGTRIGPNCWLNECTLADGVEVLANSMIDQSSVGSGARIGPFARLRPQSVVGDNVHVGNFVEIKKSNLADGAKVNHLTYVGDTDVGARVNVGAGTITCNYDGVNKHRTVIEADAFIGSGTMLVAPVVVGAGATIGAGSTISRDAPANALTFNRAKSRTVDGWLRPTKKLS